MNDLNTHHTSPLASSDARFRHALKMVKLGYWNWDLASNEIIWSAETYHFFGMDPEKDTPNMESFMAGIHPDDRERVAKNSEAVMKTGSAPDMEYRVLRADGASIYLYARAEMNHDDSGQPSSIFGTLQDITEQKRQQMALEEAQQVAEKALQAKNEFLSMMGHELNTPMNAIAGFAQLLQQDLKDAGMLECANQIAYAATELGQAFNDVIKYVNLDKYRSQLVTIPLDERLKQLIKEHQQLAHKHKVTLSCTPPPAGMSNIISDDDIFSEILSQLLSNAIAYNKPDGSVTITSTSLEDGRLQISVTDTGAGIEGQDHERIFVPFERSASYHNTHSVRGTGIGLTIARRLARSLGGDIKYDTTLGEGSVFHLQLPVAANPLHMMKS